MYQWWVGEHRDLERSKFMQNAAAVGGAIYAIGSALSISGAGSVFGDNSATEDGGAIATVGACSTAISYSVFRLNSAKHMASNVLFRLA